jgi:hypothetical protein
MERMLNNQFVIPFQPSRKLGFRDDTVLVAPKLVGADKHDCNIFCMITDFALTGGTGVCFHTKLSHVELTVDESKC